MICYVMAGLNVLVHELFRPFESPILAIPAKNTVFNTCLSTLSHAPYVPLTREELGVFNRVLDFVRRCEAALRAGLEDEEKSNSESCTA